MPKPIGNMFWFADWELCREYDPGDVVERAGVLFLCLEENAGRDPADPFHRNFWRPFGDGGGYVNPEQIEHELLAGRYVDGKFAASGESPAIHLSDPTFRALLLSGEVDWVAYLPSKAAYDALTEKKPRTAYWWPGEGELPPASVGVPPGGKKGDALLKESDTDYHMKWGIQQGGGGGTDDHEALSNLFIIPD